MRARTGMVAAVAALALAMLVPAALAQASPQRTVRFAGQELRVPASWPVYRLAENPRMCVRLDRRAVYLGTPSAEQRCPSGAMGKRRAIVVRGDGAQASARARGAKAPRPVQLAASGDFTGLGFDACTAPSAKAMDAWRDDSPYRAIGVYIGGLNRGCSQPNLTASWVREQIAEGWYLIPTYVGLQAPGSSCSSCATLSANAAIAQGRADAEDAIADAAAIGIGPGNPIYFDMESYSRTSSASSATLAFLAAWTTELHEAGYESGVYSSSASGIADLASKVGTSYAAPDHLWIANWNGQKNTDDPYVPDNAWNQHQRIHQYRGGHDETWGGVTINIDNNYVEGATVGAVASAEPVLRGRLDAVSSPLPGHVQVSGWAYDPSLPTAPAAIRAYLGGAAGKRGTKLYELGQVATLPRPDIAGRHRAAGPDHGFDVSFPVVGSRRQRVCVYAVGAGAPNEKLLGCRTVGIAVPIEILRQTHVRGGLKLTLHCHWPAGTQCPGQVLMRAKVRVGKGRRSRLIRTVVGRERFALVGAQTATVRVALSRRGRELTRGRKKVRAQLTVAIPGGKRGRIVALRR
ncbi:MAG TPA: DUF1906 domain-containing protein [Solirubrobacterales bacterium]|nr:DUF1906 domain-containing protein [Solirubrobacterales bacterium]